MTTIATSLSVLPCGSVYNETSGASPSLTLRYRVPDSSVVTRRIQSRSYAQAFLHSESLETHEFKMPLSWRIVTANVISRRRIRCDK